MSTDQSNLNEFNTESEDKGVPVAERIGRPQCRSENTYEGMPCEFPVVPGQDRCHRHMGDSSRTDSQDVGPLLSAVKGSGDDVQKADAVHCQECGHPIPAMYRPMCPECGHRRED